MEHENTPNMIEHLKMIQAVVTRMAGNSTQMKTWAVSIVTAVIVFSGLSRNPHWLIGAGGSVAVIAFWVMDARYLHLERCYIKLYEAVAAGTAIMPFDLNYRPHTAAVHSIWRVAWSWSVCIFYGSLLIVAIALSIYLAVRC